MTASEKLQSSQLYCVLLRRQEPLTDMENSGEGEGVVAWRRRADVYELAVKLKVAGQMLGVLNWKFACDVEVRLALCDVVLRPLEA